MAELEVPKSMAQCMEAEAVGKVERVSAGAALALAEQSKRWHTDCFSGSRRKLFAFPLITTALPSGYLRHLRRALQKVAAAHDSRKLWMTTPGAICRHAVEMA